MFKGKYRLSTVTGDAVRVKIQLAEQEFYLFIFFKQKVML